MIWLFVGATVAAVWLFITILYVTGDLKKIRQALCGHHSTSAISAYDPKIGRFRKISKYCFVCRKTWEWPL